MRQPTAGQPKKLTLIRPSSGYYGYNTKRADSDNESAKFSSNNVSHIIIRIYIVHKMSANCLFLRACHRAVQKVA